MALESRSRWFAARSNSKSCKVGWRRRISGVEYRALPLIFRNILWNDKIQRIRNKVIRYDLLVKSLWEVMAYL